MNRREAFAMDKQGGFYVEYDEETGLYCVFGTESGFAYYSFASQADAEECMKKNSQFNREPHAN